MNSVLLMGKSIPLIISTTFKHFTLGPPQPSWNLKVHLSLKLLQFHVSLGKHITIEESQKSNIFAQSIDPHFKVDKIFIPNEYRNRAQVYIEKLVEPYTIAINPIWKSPESDGIGGEIIMKNDWSFNEENDDWNKEKLVLYLHGGAYSMGNLDYCRGTVSKLSKASGARVLAIDYRLAPQQPFPAALCDALATYLYLTNPPDDAGFKPYKPNQIVVSGDSSGAGLSISLGLALRDLGLPPLAGIVGLSPWVDLTHSMPSFIDPITDESDFLPKKPGFIFCKPDSPVYNEFKESANNISRNIQQHSDIKLIGDDSLKRIGQPACFYMVNEGLAIPYVSPLFAESLGSLPPMLIVTGNVERLRDEDIYFSYRAANPEKYRLPAYETDFDNSHFKSPTRVTLEVYDEMFHDFQLLDSEPSKLSIQRIGDFISNVIQETTLADPPPHSFNALKISYQGEIHPLEESSIDNILKWDKVGVFPDV